MSEPTQSNKRDGWKRTTLGDALPIRYGKARSEKHGLVREETAVYGSSGVIDTFGRTLTVGPTLIIGRKGTVGATHYSPEPCWPIDTVYFAESEPDKDLRFFKYLLDHLQLGNMDRSTAVPGLSRDDYNAKEVYIPVVHEQREIVAEIEKQFTRLEAGVAGLRRVQANLKRYRAAVLKAACKGKLVPTEAELARQEGRTYETGAQLLERILTERREKWNGKGRYKEPAKPDTTNLPSLPEGWAWASLDELQILLRNGISKKPDAEAGLPILRISAVRPMSLDIADTRFLRATSNDYTEFCLNEGDLLFTRYNGNPDLVGGCAVVPTISFQIVHPDKLIRCKLVSDDTLPKFVAIMANVGASRNFLARRVRTTAGQSGISGGDLKVLPIPVAPRHEQQRIVAEVERRLSVVEELEVVVNANLQRAIRLRQAILQRAFEGSLLQSQHHTATTRHNLRLSSTAHG